MTILKRACGLLLALALVLGLQAVAYAQTGAASITGLVTDQSGAVTPGVTVVATNQATNVEYTAVSNQAGNYNILSVPVGRYVVKATLTGFKTRSIVSWATIFQPSKTWERNGWLGSAGHWAGLAFFTWLKFRAKSSDSALRASSAHQNSWRFTRRRIKGFMD